MPIYEQGYEAYQGRKFSQRRRWIPLWREEIMPFIKKRIFVILLILAVMPWFYGIALTFLHTQLGNADWAKEMVSKLPEVDEKLVAQLLTNGWNIFMLIIVSVWVGSGLVARDTKERTLEVFLGRAIGPVQYLFAKGAALMSFLLVFSLLPTVVLVIFHIGLSGDVMFLWNHGRVLWGTALYTAVGPGSLCLFILALSSLSRSPRLVGLGLIGLFFFGGAGGEIIRAITSVHAASLLDFGFQLHLLGQHCLQAGATTSVPLGYTVLFFALLISSSLAVLYLRFSNRGVLR